MELKVPLGQLRVSHSFTVFNSQAYPCTKKVLEKEIRMGMALLGAPSVKDLKPEMLELLDGLVGTRCN